MSSFMFKYEFLIVKFDEKKFRKKRERRNNDFELIKPKYYYFSDKSF